MDKIKILHIHPHDEQLLNYIEFDNKISKYKNDIVHHNEILLSKRAEESSAYDNVFRVPILTKSPLKWIFGIRKVVLEGRYDIIHCHLGWFSLFAMLSLLFVPAKKIVHVHNPMPSNFWLKYFYCPLAKFLINLYFDVKLSCSKENGEQLFIRHFEVIPNIIDYNKFYFNQDLRDKHRSLNHISNDNFVIFHVGNFSKIKNHYFLINCFKEIYSNIPNSVLMLVGYGSNDEVQYIKSHISKNGLDKVVIILGTRGDVSELYSCADLFIYPSFFEGFGMSLLEAQISGLQCFYSNTIPKETIILPDRCVGIDLDEGHKFWATQILNSFKLNKNVSRKVSVPQKFNSNFNNSLLFDLYLNLTSVK